MRKGRKHHSTMSILLVLLLLCISICSVHLAVLNKAELLHNKAMPMTRWGNVSLYQQRMLPRYPHHTLAISTAILPRTIQTLTECRRWLSALFYYWLCSLLLACIQTEQKKQPDGFTLAFSTDESVIAYSLGANGPPLLQMMP